MTKASTNDLKENYKDMITKYDKEIALEKDIKLENLFPNYKNI